MNTTIRPRITSKPAGKSGSMTLKGLDLKQDKAGREALRKQDIADYLAAGGHQAPTTIITAALQLELDVAELFSTNSWDEYAGANL